MATPTTGVAPTPPIQRSVEDIAPARVPFGFDFLLALSAIGLIACSLVTLATATQDDVAGQEYFYVYRQAIYAVTGVVLMVIVSRFDYSRLRELRFGLYGIMLSAIAAVLLIGEATHGSRRWIEIPFFRFQPSELGKILLIVVLAGFMVGRVRRLSERDTTARAMLLALVPAALVMAQPDLGSGLVYVVVAVAALFVAGVSWRHFAGLFGLFAAAIVLALVALPAAGIHPLKPYQVDRLTAFLHPSDNPRSEGYQQNQSRIAIGAGRKTGRGPDQATQTTLNFLPAHHTDFIFAVVGETYGFVGGAIVLALYALMIWRGLRILTLAKNLFGALIAGGIVAMLMFHVFVNVGMTIGITPITGVPLPLLSYGGSSVLVTFLALGLLQSIYAQARIAAAGKARALTL